MRQVIFWGSLILIIISCNSKESSGATTTDASANTEAQVKSTEEDVSVIETTMVDENRKQLIVKTTGDEENYVLFGQELINGEWTVTYDTIACTVGYNGIAKVGEKREGDGKTPAGTYPLGQVFGYDDDLDLGGDFIELEPFHYWVSDASSPLYNTLIDYDPSPLVAEKMERNDHLYKYGIIINYNTDPVVPGNGSAIFLHIYRSPEKPTAGCVAVSEEKLVELIHWLQNTDYAEISIFK